MKLGIFQVTPGVALNKEFLIEKKTSTSSLCHMSLEKWP